jgi:AcrR family transcriptional regulator
MRALADLTPLGARPRQARSLKTRERFYEASLRRFAEDGVDETRVQDILADAGGSWGAYHHYFPRKEDVLLERAVRQIRETIRPRADAALSDRRASIRKALEEIHVAMVSSELPRHLHGAILREATANPRRLAEMLDDDELPLLGIVGLLLEAGQGRREVRDDADPYTLGASLSAGTMWPVIQTAFGPPLRGLEGAARPPDPVEAVRRTFAITWRAVEA